MSKKVLNRNIDTCINSLDDPNRYSKLDKLDMWLFDHVWFYRFCYYIYRRTVCLPKVLKRFIQRLTRGWDDSETWNLDTTFMKWLLPRLKRFREISCAYPCEYTEEKWDKELDTYINILEKLLKSAYTEYEYIYGNTPEENVKAYWNDYKKFMKWFSKNLPNLWW